MNAELKNYLAQVKLGEAQTYKHITIVPLIGPTDGEPNYLTLTEAIETGQFTVTEVSQGGSVPELKVVNRLAQPVLLLDGEELLGAKQNRVLSTTILLKESLETVVPVSCTEQGRWAYSSPAFSSSDVIMAHKVRMRQSRSVSRSLEMGSPHVSDQSEVWRGIADLHQKVGTHSPTGAMHDAYVQRQAEIEAAIKSFPCVAGQSGLLVLVDGEDCRFKKPGMAGTALVHDQHAVHAAFFRMNPADEGSHMTSLRHRRQRCQKLDLHATSFKSQGF